MNKYIPEDKAVNLLQTLKEAGHPYFYEEQKHRIILEDVAGNEIFTFRLPITVPAPGKEKEQPVHYILLLIQSGNCAIGYFEDGVNLDHKVFRSYMVRKKQGKSQIKYLKTKGKSRAGSRVRLGETVEFFENINQRLQEYFEEHDIDRIAISCSKTLIPYLYGSKVATPFDKKDERIFKIPKHIHTPIYDVMMDTHKFLQKGELIFEPAQQAFVHSLLGEIPKADEEEDHDE
jgi:hypothetical protein